MLQRYLAEEDWMLRQGPTSEFRLNVSSSAMLNPFLLSQTTTGGTGSTRIPIGTDRDFAWGFMLGFFVGFVMLVWVWIPTVPQKQKSGILTGITFQSALAAFAESPGVDEEEYSMED